MFDPVQDDTRSRDASFEGDRTVKIEQLLLSGLDHYFKGRYEHAIDVWTRVLFLDRSHARARAYVERARGALGERLRQSEELVHTGVEAFNRGDVKEARSLLTSAVKQGGGRDEALTVLARMNRLEGASGEEVVSRRGRRAGRNTPRLRSRPPDAPVRKVRVLPLVLLGALLGGVGYVAVAGGEWQPILLGAPERSPVPVLETVDRLPIPTGAELRLSRARRLVADGRLHEALSVLATVEAGDPLAAEVEVLTATVQRRLLAAVDLPAGDTGGDR